MKRLTGIAGIMMPVLVAGPALAGGDDRKVPPAALARLLDCRAVADSATRLACFDGSAAALDRAYVGGDIAVVDREDVRKTKRGLFGFSLANIPIFGDRDGGKDDGGRDEADEIKEITGTLKAVAQGYDGLIFTLEDGARWQQTQPMTFGRTPRPGMKIVIKRAALGSYKLSVEGSPSVKAKRIG